MINRAVGFLRIHSEFERRGKNVRSIAQLIWIVRQITVGFQIERHVSILGIAFSRCGLFGFDKKRAFIAQRVTDA